MRERWRKLAERFAALKPRERALVLLGVVIGGALIYDAPFARTLEASFLHELAQAREVSLADLQRRTWVARSVEALARLAAPLF